MLAFVRVVVAVAVAVVVKACSAALAAGAVVAPVPPLAIARVPANVTAPVVAVFGVRPVVPAVNDVTPLAGAATHDAVVPLEVSR